MNEIFIPNSQKVIEIFGGDKCYQVPDYQRPYSWDSEQVEELWDDIFNAFENDEPEYFLGSIILTRNDNNKYLDLIDGQQRLTTLTILFCVLRDLYYLNHEDSTKKNRILGRIKNIENDLERLKFRTQTQHQNEFEQEIIKSIDFNKKNKDYKKNKFFNTAHIFKEKINDLKNNDPLIIEDFTEYILEKVRLITIECTQKSFAIKLFQVLNNRGMALNDSDLIKSYLMSNLGDKEEDFVVFNNEWIEIEKTAEDIEENLTNLFTYYEYYLLASNPKKRLYEELEKQFKNKDPKEIIFEFKKLIRYFNKILNKKSKEIYSLYYLKHNIYWKSILLTAKLKGWGEEDFDKLVKELRRFYYLYWVADYTTQKIKQTSFNIINWIKESKNIDFISNELNKKIKSDNVIVKAIRNLNGDVYDTPWLKPLLILLEYQQTDGSNINLIEISNILHVEHILPKAFSQISYWSERFSHEQGNNIVNSIGNLTLLSGKKNIQAGNKPFPDKLKTYDGKGIDGITGFRITQSILDQTRKDEEWTLNKINDRKENIMQNISKLFEIDAKQDIFEDDEESIEIINEKVEYEEEDHLNNIELNIKKIYVKLKDFITNLDKNIIFNPQKYYISLKDNKNFAFIKIRNKKLKIIVMIPYEEGIKIIKNNEVKELSKSVQNFYNGPCFSIILENEKNLEEVLNALKLAYGGQK